MKTQHKKNKDTMKLIIFPNQCKNQFQNFQEIGKKKKNHNEKTRIDSIKTSSGTFELGKIKSFLSSVGKAQLFGLTLFLWSCVHSGPAEDFTPDTAGHQARGGFPHKRQFLQHWVGRSCNLAQF